LQTLALSTSAEVIDNTVSASFTVNVVVSETGAIGDKVFVKVNTDAGALPAFGAAPTVTSIFAGGFGDAVSVAKTGSHALLFTVPNGVVSFSFSLASTPALSGFAEITAFLVNQALNDCATDTATLLVGPEILLGTCACATEKATIQLTPAGCAGTCSARKRNASSALVKRAANVPGVVAQADFSVTYRRTTKESSSSHSVSRCGPRVLFLVADKVIYSNDATVLFGDQGVISGSIQYEVPSTLLPVEIRVSKGKHCDGFDLVTFDRRFEVRTVGLLPGGVDPASPKASLKN